MIEDQHMLRRAVMSVYQARRMEGLRPTITVNDDAPSGYITTGNILMSDVPVNGREAWERAAMRWRPGDVIM